MKRTLSDICSHFQIQSIGLFVKVNEAMYFPLKMDSLNPHDFNMLGFKSLPS
jgi:hypothetical protein